MSKSQRYRMVANAEPKTRDTEEGKGMSIPEDERVPDEADFAIAADLARVEEEIRNLRAEAEQPEEE